jgi:hypothetical protein
LRPATLLRAESARLYPTLRLAVPASFTEKYPPDIFLKYRIRSQ